MTAEHGLPIVRACQVARLSRAAYYRPGMDWTARDGEVIAALQAIVVEKQRWGFWKCHDRLRAQGFRWNHKRTWRVYSQLCGSTYRGGPNGAFPNASGNRYGSSRG
jgi:putative transposase